MSLNAIGRAEMGRNWVGRRQIWPDVTSFLEKTVFVVNNSSRIFENIPQNGPEYSHRKLASFLVSAVRKNIGDLLSWLVSLSSSVPEITRHGLETGLHVNS